MYGLKYVPDLGSKAKNDLDKLPGTKRNVPLEFSKNDQQLLLDEFLAAKDGVKTILEIGVARLKGNMTYNTTSTSVFVNNKRSDAVYIGVDIEDRSYVKGENVFTLKCSSSEFDKIVGFIKEKTGSKSIDVLFIDGWHSVNQVLAEWRFAELLSDNGIVFFHDTNVHPGPVEVVKAIDDGIFLVEKHFEDDPHDWGLTVVKKK